MKTVQIDPKNTPSQRAARFALGLGLAATMALSAVMPTLAAPDLTITAAPLGFGVAPVVNAATGVTLDGTNKTSTYTINLDVNDPTGTGAGWNVTMTSTTFVGPATGSAPNAGKSLSATASTIAARAEVTCSTSTTCTPATDVAAVVAYPYAVPAAVAAPTATKMTSTAAGTGLGRMTFSPSVNIAIPANTYAGTYTSTVTLALVSAP